jgi:hypothetical protein
MDIVLRGLTQLSATGAILDNGRLKTGTLEQKGPGKVHQDETLRITLT